MVSDAALGGQVGQALNVGGEIASKIYKERVAQIDQSVALDAHNQKNDFNQKKLFSKDGLLNQNTGVDAPGAVDNFMSDYDANTAKIAAGLKNDNQRQSFARLAQENRYQVQNHLNNYEIRQVDGYHEQVAHAAVANSVVSAVQGVDGVIDSPDPKLMDVATRKAAIAGAANNSIEIGEAAIRDNEARKNTPKEVVDAKVAEYQSNANYSIIQSLTSKGKDEDAAAYYEANKGKLIGQDAVRAASTVTDGTAFGDASRTVDATAYDKDGKLRDRSDVESDLLKTSKYQTNEKYASAIDRQLDKRYRIANQVEQKQQGDILSSYQKTLIENGGDLDAMKASDPDAWTRLHGDGQAALIAYSQKLSKHELPQNGSASFVFRSIQAGDQEIDKNTGLTGEETFNNLSSKDVYKLALEMSPTDHEKIVNMWKRGNAKDEKNDDIAGVRSTSTIIKTGLAKAGMPISPMTIEPGTGKAIYNKDTDTVLTVINTDLENWKMNNPGKRNVPNDIAQGVVDRAVMKAADTGRVHALDVPPGTIANIRQADEGKKRAAIQSLIEKKVPINDASILGAYNEMRKNEANPPDIQKELREKKRKADAIGDAAKDKAYERNPLGPGFGFSF